MPTLRPLAAFSLVVMLVPAGQAAERDVVRTPVPHVLPERLRVGAGEVPIETSPDWSAPLPGVVRALIVIHGWPRRDLHSGVQAVAAAGDAARGTLVVTPQFLAQVDVDAKGLSAATLRWRIEGWQQGLPALAPAPLSSFDVVDAIVRRLADRTRFPDLKTVVLAGHSAGGQFVQRYAAVGRGADALAQSGIHLRVVVANPSSYLYFDAARPEAVDGARCAAVDRWKYGFGSGLPPYVAQPGDVAALRRAYARRDVVYLLGDGDTDPDGDGLDRSCAAAAQGPTRLARGRAYVTHLRALEPTTRQRIVEVPGIGHRSGAMFTSTCGGAALFDAPGCETAPR